MEADGLLNHIGEEASTEKKNVNSTKESTSDTHGASTNNLCEECEDRRRIWDCDSCGGVFCDVCFYALHRKGKRALHKPERIARPSSGGATGAGGGGSRLLSGWIGPRLSAKEEVNPDMHDRCLGSQA